MIFSHSSLFIFNGLIIDFTSSSRISAPAPGNESNPDSFNLDNTSLVVLLSTLEIVSISEAESP
jgi:hypothetical protein